MKRKREVSAYENKPYKKVRATAKKPYVQTDTRAGYSTVARTRGVYGQGEMKYYDTELAPAAIASNGTWNATMLDPSVLNTLFVPTVGAAINQRIGKSAEVYKIKIRGLVGATPDNDTSVNKGCCVRLALVEDMQTNGTQMTGAGLYSIPVTSDAELASTSFQNINNFGRFRVLKDKLYTLNDPNMAGDTSAFVRNGMVRAFKWTIKFSTPRKVRFNATNGGTIADIVDNSWHIVGLASDAGLSPYLTYQCRVCYKE